MKDLEDGDQFAVDGVQVADVGFGEAVERAVEGGDEPGDQHCRFSLQFPLSVWVWHCWEESSAREGGGGWELRAKTFPPPPDSENNPESEHQPVPILP